MLRINHKFSRRVILIGLSAIIAIIIILAIVFLIVLNPAKRLQDARDARRTTDVETILTAVHKYIVDNQGSLPTGMSTGMPETQLGTAGSGAAISTGGCAATASAALDLSTPLVKYIKSIPVDPKTGTASLTLYTASADANNIITIKACGTEGSSNISSSR